MASNSDEALDFGFFDDLETEELSEVNNILQGKKAEKNNKKPQFFWLSASNQGNDAAEEMKPSGHEDPKPNEFSAESPEKTDAHEDAPAPVPAEESSQETPKDDATEKLNEENPSEPIFEEEYDTPEENNEDNVMVEAKLMEPNLSNTYPYLTPQAPLGLVTSPQQQFVMPYALHPSVVAYTGAPVPLPAHAMPIMSHPGIPAYTHIPFVGLPTPGPYGFPAHHQIPIIPNPLAHQHPHHGAAIRPELDPVNYSVLSHMNVTAVSGMNMDFVMPRGIPFDAKVSGFEGPSSIVTANGLSSSSANSQDAAKPRRNKKKRPPGYYDQAAEQEAINRRKLQEGSQIASTETLSGSDDMQSSEVSQTSEENINQNSCAEVEVDFDAPAEAEYELVQSDEKLTNASPPPNSKLKETSSQSTQKVFFDSSLVPHSLELTFASGIQFLSDESLSDCSKSNEHNSSGSSSCIVSSQLSTNSQLSQASLVSHTSGSSVKEPLPPTESEQTFDVSASPAPAPIEGDEDEARSNSDAEIPVTDNAKSDETPPSPSVKDTEVDSNSEQTSKDSEQTSKDSEQTSKDSEQTSKESEQTSRDAKPSENPASNLPKTNSWAGLFYNTKSAQNAIVISSGAAEKTETTSRSSSSSRIEKDRQLNGNNRNNTASIPQLCSVKDDRLAAELRDRTLYYNLKYKGISLLPRGIQANRNCCYVNAILQALVATPPFYQLFRHLVEIMPYNRGPTSTPVLDAMAKFVGGQFEHIKASTIPQIEVRPGGPYYKDLPVGRIADSSPVLQLLQLPKYAKLFMHGRQEDAQELLTYLLNDLHEEFVAIIKDEDNVAATTNGMSNDTSNNNDEDDGWAQVGPKNKAVLTRVTATARSPVSDMFQGQIRFLLQQGHARETANLQPFVTLQLDVQSDRVRSVRDALEELVRRETLQDYMCARTKQEVEASKRAVLEHLPPILVLHLKYFVYDKKEGIAKVKKNIEVPADLEIAKELCYSSKYRTNPKKYKLYAVVNHIGEKTQGGHYTAHVFHPGITGWLHIDDENVKTVPVHTVLQCNWPRVPYLLFYRVHESTKRDLPPKGMEW